MPPDSFELVLDRAAALFGIAAGFYDIFGTHHVTTTAGKQSILRALGVEADSTEGLERSLAELTRREWSRLLPPAVVAGTGGVEVPLSIPSELLGHAAQFTVRAEDGTEHRFDVALQALAQVGAIEMDGRTLVRKMAPLPVTLPLGYHEISVT